MQSSRVEPMVPIPRSGPARRSGAGEAGPPLRIENRCVIRRPSGRQAETPRPDFVGTRQGTSVYFVSLRNNMALMEGIPVFLFETITSLNLRSVASLEHFM
jgi:hypothetical protein